MPYCLTHGFQQGNHCQECGAPLSDSPPAAGDRIHNRSGEATAIVNITPGAKAPRRPTEVECPRCGHFNAMRNTFNCKGGCGQQNLCRRHFDEEYEVCIDCARTRRGIAKAEAERQTKFQADLAAWRRRAEQAEAQVAELGRQGSETQEALEEAYIDLAAEQERTNSLARELDTAREQARQTAARVQALEAQIAQLQSERNQAREALERLRVELEGEQEQVQSLERELKVTRYHLQQAEAEVDRSTQNWRQTQQALEQAHADLRQTQERMHNEEHKLAVQSKYWWINEGWRTLVEALTDIDSRILLNMRVAIRTLDDIVSEYSQDVAECRQLCANARFVSDRWRGAVDVYTNEWYQARKLLVHGRFDQAFKAFERLYRNGIQGDVRYGQTEESLVYILQTIAEQALELIQSRGVAEATPQQLKIYAERSAELAQHSGNVKVREQAKTASKTYDTLQRAAEVTVLLS